MSVSNERLDTLIAETAHTAKTWKDFDSEVSAKNPEYESIVQSKCDDLLSALKELRGIRQSATAGVEEAASKLVKIIEAKISEYLPGDFALPDDDAQAVRDFLVALLAERDAMLRECQSFIGKLSDRAERFHFADADRDTMAAMLSRIAALTKGGG